MTDTKLRDTSALPSTAPFNGLNKQFHEQLDRLSCAMRQKLNDGTIPVIVRMDSRIILTRGDVRSIFEINQTYYHQLKALAHLPLLLFLSAFNENNTARTKHQFRKAIAEFKAENLFPARLLSLIENAAEHLFSSSHWPGLEFSAVRQFNDALQPAFQSLISSAAENEAEQTLKALRQVEATLGDTQLLHQSFYVICAGHQPRYKLLGKQMLERWVYEQTKSPEEVERRVLYGESLDSVDAARELVVTRMVNGLIGDAFLNSPLSMNQDVLGQAGELAVQNAFTNDASDELLN